MDIPIIFEDGDLIVVDKPPGVVVNRAESVKGETVEAWAEAHFKSQITNSNIQKNIDTSHWSLRIGHCDFCSRAGVVHRIDKETSGVLILAKNPTVFLALQGQFKERSIQKIYLAIVHGKPPQEGVIDAPVDRLPWNRERFGIVPGGKESVTAYKRINSFELRAQGRALASQLSQKETISLVEVYPKTGRTHQIRVHFKYIGYPLVGDYLYAGRKTSRDDRIWAPRVMLHAWKIGFSHPVSGEQLAFEADIPDDMKRIIHPDK